jgi:hypothetical protein
MAAARLSKNRLSARSGASIAFDAEDYAKRRAQAALAVDFTVSETIETVLPTPEQWLAHQRRMYAEDLAAKRAAAPLYLSCEDSECLVMPRLPSQRRTLYVPDFVAAAALACA